MYRGLSQTWRGFTKNAYEGLGSFGLLMFFTIIHLLAHVLPWVVVASEISSLALGRPADRAALLLAILCVASNLVQRVLLSSRFRQGITPVLLHPVGVLFMTLIQWRSFYLALTNQRSWRGRVGIQPAASAPKPL